MQGKKHDPSMAPLVRLWVIVLHNEFYVLKLHLQLFMTLQDPYREDFASSQLAKDSRQPNV